MFSVNVANSKLLRKLPAVKRARDYHLYLDGGKRLVDLWLFGGRALLGHKSPNTVRELKNSAERGLFVPFPHFYEARFIKALQKLFPGKYFSIFSSEEALRNALDDTINLNDILWRPFSGEENDKPRFVPVLPWPLSPLVLVETEKIAHENELIPPVLLAPAVRALYDLIASEKTRGNLNFPRINKALKMENCKWRQKGIYLYLNTDENFSYEGLWFNFLEEGFLLPPNKNDPLILPGIMSEGEEVKLAKLLSFQLSPYIYE